MTAALSAQKAHTFLRGTYLRPPAGLGLGLDVSVVIQSQSKLRFNV